MDGWGFVLLLWLCLLRSYLGELLDRVGLRVDGDDGHDKEDREADDLVGVRIRVGVRVSAARVRVKIRVGVGLGIGVGLGLGFDCEAGDRGEVTHDRVEVAEHLDRGQLAHLIVMK